MIQHLRRTATQVVASRHRSLWPIGCFLAALAALAIFRNDPATWIGDNRYELYANPGRRVSRMLSIWDSSRGLGRIRADFWPGVTLIIGVFRTLGMSPAVAEHAWHTTLIAGGGIGAVAFLRCFVPRIGLAHVVTGLLYMFGPYTVGFLLPSNLYLNYAVAPWIFLMFFRAVHAVRPWRWVAGLALLVFMVGNTEVSGLIYAFAYLLPISLHLVYIRRTTTWARIRWWVFRFGALALAVSAVAIFTSIAGGEIFDQNLRETEAPTVLNGNSSWAESWRGLGSWLVYHRDTSGFARPATLTFLSSVPILLASFAAPTAAVAALGVARERCRFLFGAMMMMGLLIMVGLYPLSDPSPYGDAVDSAYGWIPKLTILRNNYKAGSGAMLGMTALAGLAVAWGWDRLGTIAPQGRGWLSGGRIPKAATAAGLFFVMTVVSQPFWKGELYNPTWELDEIPEYVDEAAAWLDDQPGGSRVLFLPRAYRNGFRWGWVNDDVLDALVARPHAVEVPIHLSRPIPADLLANIDAAVVNRLYQEGDIGPLARILGVDLIVIRNDHDWQTWGQPRPALLDELRSDPALAQVATFGAAGENVVADGDQSLAARREIELSPIEIYRVKEAPSIVRMEPPGSPLLVSGNGNALIQMATEGIADAFPGARYTGSLSATELTQALSDGSPLMITDSYRRRVEIITTEAQGSHTLAAGEELDRAPFPLFDNPGSEAVATYGDLAEVSASGRVSFTGGLQPWHRPSAALDGDVNTSWLVGGLSDPLGETFRVDMVRPKMVSGIQIRAAESSRSIGRNLEAVTVTFSDGTVAAARFDDDGLYKLDFEARSIEWVRVTITGVRGAGLGPVGIAEMNIFGVESRERIVASSDVFQAAQENPALAQALQDASIGYAFERVVGDGPVDEERQFAREFQALQTDVVVVEGQLSISGSTPDELLTLIGNHPVQAVASTRLSGGVQFRGALAADGLPGTAWVAEPLEGATVTLTFSERVVQNVQVATEIGQGLSSITEVEVVIGDERFTADIPGRSCGDSPQCTVRVSVPVGGIETTSLVLSVKSIETSGQQGTNPIRVSEIGMNGWPNPSAPFGATETGCIDGLVELDFQNVPVRLRSGPGVILTGRAVSFVSCSPVTLLEGLRTIDNRSGAIINNMLILPPVFGGARRFEGGLDRSNSGVDVIFSNPTEMAFSVDAPEGGWLSLGQSYHPSWEATIDGVDLGPPIELDTFAAFKVPPGTTGVVQVRFTMQRPFEISIVISLLGVLISLWLVLRRDGHQ